MRKILELRGITKQFPAVQALQNVNINVYEGKVMGLLGENGAGKSTLVKVLTGVHQPNRGQIFWEGQKVSLSGIGDAKKLGISIIHQELSLLPTLSIAENIFLDNLPVNRLGKICWRKVNLWAKSLLKKVCVQRNPWEMVKELSISEQQLVEIAKALAKDSRVVIMDEPTDSLTDKEVENLFAIIRNLKTAGKTIIYITHRLNEVFQICDYVTILRDGTFVCEAPCAEMDENKLIKAMVGRELNDQFPRVEPSQGAGTILELQDVCNGKLEHIDLQVKSGEILGLLGLMGAGRTELAKTIYGYYPLDSGRILLGGRELRLRSPASGVANQIAYVSEDRKSDGLVLRLAIKDNMVLSALNKFENRFKKINIKKESKAVQSFIEDFGIKAPGMLWQVGMLSGGNQQKVSIAKALMADPKVLILDEPTRGIDVGAKKEIYDLINRLKLQGLAIILISSEMPEILGLSDRIAVMCNRRITGIFSTKQTEQEKLLKYATDF